MGQIFIKLYDILAKHRWMVLLIVIVLFAGMGVLSSRLTLREDISNFLPDKGGNMRLSPIYKHLSLGNEIFVTLSTTDSLDEDERITTLSDAAETFSSRLDSIAGRKLIRNIICHIDAAKMLDIANFISSNLPYFLEESDYTRMDSIMKAGNLGEMLHNDRSLMTSPMGMGIDENILADPYHFSLPVLQRLRQMQYSKHYAVDDDYIFTSDHRRLILFVFSANGGSETAQNTLLAKAFDKAAASMPSHIKVRYFGAPLVAVANATQIKADTLKSVCIASFIILLILLLFFKDLRPLIYVMVSVAFGTLFGLALIFLLQGQVSSIALGAGSVIIGIAINYALHYCIHLQHHPDPRTVLRDIATPMVVGNITTVGAFLSLLLISAQAMRDLGLFAALALVGTILFVLCILPHWAKRGRSTKLHVNIERRMDTSLERNKWLVWTCIIVTVFLSFFCNDVKFETDFNKINYMTSEQREALSEMKSITTLGDKSIYHISQGRTLNAALRVYEQQRPVMAQLKKSGVLLAWNDLWSFLPSDSLQAAKIARWNIFRSKYKEQLLRVTASEGRRYGFSQEAFAPFDSLMRRDFKVVTPSYFKLLTDNMMKESIIQDKDSTSLISVLYTRQQQSKEVYRRLDNRAHSFVFDMQSMTTQLVNILSNDFNLVFYVCGFLVFFFLWYSFGRIELSGIAFLPMAISWIWILGIMSLFDIRFNIVNIILSTFIFGLGDDYTIFIVDGLMYEYAYRKKMLSSYKTSVFLSALFMLVGIGSLIIASHPAVRSLAEITIIGMFCVVLIAFIVPPLLFHWMVEKKGRHRLMPITWSNLLLTIFSFIIFLIGSTSLTFYGYWLLKIQRPTDKNKLRLHKALQAASRFVVRYIPGVKHHLIDFNPEVFSHPNIIICNHQSHLDLMYLLMMSPKIIVVTNQWAWNFVGYRRFIRFADFYPVASGIDESLDKLKEMTDKGYSIAIFPEGTRSEDGTIGRFHRGAFYLAEKLQCDILPVVFHGIGHVLPKSELILRRGPVTVKCLPPITPSSTEYGIDYVERSKQIRRLITREYEELVRKNETVSYFLDDIRGSYRYKGEKAESEVRHSLHDIQRLTTLIDSLPADGNVVMTHCGIGCITLLAALVRKDVTICGMDIDEEAIAMASNCRLVPKNLTYQMGTLNNDTGTQHTDDTSEDIVIDLHTYRKR
jgi:1-acyl-sn-glycerol-3-phosphate acyltransferase